MNVPSSKTTVFRPTNAPRSLAAWLSPVVTSTPSERLVASTDAEPPDTRPMTWPATPSPDVDFADWLEVKRLFPFWRFSQPMNERLHDPLTSDTNRSPK